MSEPTHRLPLAATTPAPTEPARTLGSHRPPEPAHDLGDSCITCGDVARALTVVEVLGTDARCRAEDGGEELVAIDLVGPVSRGDRVLVHARVALETIPDDDRTTHALR